MIDPVVGAAADDEPVLAVLVASPAEVLVASVEEMPGSGAQAEAMIKVENETRWLDDEDIFLVGGT